jgi:arsenite-transporting ATPase
MVGLDAIRALVGNMPSHESISPSGLESKECDSYKDGTLKKVSLAGTSLVDLVDEIETDRKGLVMVLGKGGVGKTTIAAAIALALASRGHAVHLTTTDPAAHLSLAIDSPFPNLVVDRINPEVEVERYRQGILDTQGKGLDEASRSLLVEDLRSPCTEEIAVFKAFARVIDESRGKFVIVDTAPTGHTLLLLDATGAYHREVSRHTEDILCIRTALTQLQDPSQTKMILVTLAETTPLLEAIDLQEDLRRAKIEPWAWVVNSSIFLAKPTDPLLVARSESEVKHILKVKEMNKRYAIVPWQVAEPSGIEKLLALTKPTAGG